MAISTNGTVLARVAGALYNTQMSNATYKEVASLDPATLMNTLYARDFSSSTDAAVATTLVTNLGLASVTGLNNWVAAQLTAAGSAKGAKVVDLLNSFAQMTADTTYGAYATAFNAKVDAALALSQTTDNKGGTFAAAGTPVNATFALTTGADVTTLGAGDDIINATVATLGALDVIDGGAGNDTLNIVDTAAVATLGGATFSNIEKVNITSGGAIGAVASAAGTNTAPTAQVATVLLTGTFVATDTVSVTLNGVTWTKAVGTVSSADYSGRAEAAAAIKSIISDHAGDSVSLGSTVHDSGTSSSASTFLETAFTVTSLSAGVPLGITVAKGTVASSAATIAFATASASQGTDVAAKTVTANVAGTAPTAVKEVKVLTLGDATLATGLTVSIGGVDYAGGVTGSLAANLATDVARVVNSVLGAGTAVADTTAGTVTITAPVAGTPLPLLNVAEAAGTAGTEAWATTVQNKTATATAASAVAITAPSTTTAYSATATGVANVSAPATSTLTVSGTAVKASGGTDVTVTASDSVWVSGAKGVVKVTTGAITSTSTTMIGAVRSDSGSSTGGDAKGVYVTGGTDVSVTVSGTNTQAIKIGAAAYAKDAVNATGYPKSNGNAAYDPTGNVTVTGATSTTSTTTGKKDATFNTGAVDIYTNGGSTVTVKGAGTTTVTDQGTFGLRLASTDLADTIGTSTVTTVNLAGLGGNATITSDAISTVSVSDTPAARTVTVANSGKAGANAGAINFVVSNLGGASANVTLKDDTATTVNVSSGAATAYDSIGGASNVVNAGSKSYIVLDTAKATSVNFTNDKSVALASSTLTATTTITASGTGALDLGTVGSASDKLTLVDGSAASGAITATYSATNGTAGTAHNLTFKGGAGNDVVTIAGTINSAVNTTYATTVQNVIQLGAGNDTVLLGSSGVIAAGALVDGGTGTDTIAASLLNSGNASIIQNFEVLGLDLTSGSYDSDLLAGATGLALLGQGATYLNVEQAQGLTVVTGASSASTAVTTLSFTTANVAGAADAYTVSFAQSAPASTSGTHTLSDAGVIAIEGIETVNIVSGGTGYLDNAITVTDTAARNVVLSGAQGLQIDFSSGTGYPGSTAATATNGLGVATIDGSAMTGKLDVSTANVTAAYTNITIKGGSNDDTITLSGSGIGDKAIVDAGAGNDAITTTTGKANLTLGAGVDTVTVATSVVGTLSSTPLESEVTGRLITINDFAVGDKIDFSTNTVTAYALGLAQSTGSATSLLTALNAINGATAQIAWGVYAGNTYIVWDASGTTGAVAAGDIVVKLAGIVDLSNSSISAGDILTLV